MSGSPRMSLSASGSSSGAASSGAGAPGIKEDARDFMAFTLSAEGKTHGMVGNRSKPPLSSRWLRREI